MGKPQDKIKLFESRQVRAEWDVEAERWWFSVLDIIAILTDQPDYKKVRNYWKWLKNKACAARPSHPSFCSTCPTCPKAKA